MPDPTPLHASIMADFAVDVVTGMERVLAKKRKAGMDVGTLSIRVGFHSGPVIAGVLRGAKCLFQVFGDTVNTASRMESTGKSGWIQMSEFSADLLTANNSRHQIMKRPEKVFCKGKGELTTYWLVFPAPRRSILGGVSMNNGGASGGNSETRRLSWFESIQKKMVNV